MVGNVKERLKAFFNLWHLHTICTKTTLIPLIIISFKTVGLAVSALSALFTVSCFQCTKEKETGNAISYISCPFCPFEVLVISNMLSSMVMDEDFDLPVKFKGNELQFKSRLLAYGYVHRFSVMVNGKEVIFEPDEERAYRALVAPEEVDKMKGSEIELLQAIAKALET
jgi:hypothetical protein